MAGERQCHQSQARRPAFGCRDQRLERAVGQPHPRRLQQRARLLEREAKVLAPDLGQLPRHTQAVQPKAQIAACQQHESQLRRRGREQQLHVADGLVRLEFVQVVDHQPQRLRKRAQVFEQPSDDVRAVQMRGGRQLPHPSRSGTGLAQRVEHRDPEHLRIALPTPHRHPRRPVLRRCAAIHERSRNVFPLPAGADTCTTRCAAPSRSNSSGRAINQLRTPRGRGGFDGCSRVGHTHMVALPRDPPYPPPHPNDAMRAHPPDADPNRMPAEHTASGSHRSPRYEIHVRGPIGPTIMQAFPTLAASRSGQDTVLTGSLPDQAALYGVIHQLEALGLELLEVLASRPSRDRALVTGARSQQTT